MVNAKEEMKKAEKQVDEFNQSIKDMTMDRANMAPKQELEPQTKLSQKDIEKSKEIYLKPKRTIGSREKFNEDYRTQYNEAKEYVQFIAENKEIIGESLDLWTKPFAGMPAENWEVPVNKPVWGPRYLAEQINRKFYHRFVMSDVRAPSEGAFQMYGSMAVDTTIERLSARPVSTRKSIFMGAAGF